MRTYGDKETLKSAIESKYHRQMAELESETEDQIDRIKKDAMDKITGLRDKADLVNESESKKLHSKIVSEEELKAKSEFEGKREKIIEKVFNNAKKEALKVAHSKKYLDFVSRSVPEDIMKNAEVFGDNAFYKKEFTKLKIKKDLVGIQVKTENVLYDLTLDGAIDAKKEQLRDIISKTLFED